MTTQTLQQALWSKNFEEIENIISNDTSVFESLNDFNKGEFYKALISNKQFSLLDTMQDECFEMDLYEYDSLKNSVFENMIEHIPNDEESHDYFENFFNAVDSKNEAVGGKTLIQIAIEKKASVEILKRLINAGVDANYIDNADRNYLHQIASARMFPAAIAQSYFEVFTDEGLSVEQQDSSKNTVLHNALLAQNTDLIPVILDQGADANEQNNKGKSAFFIVLVENRQYDLFEQMCEYTSPDLDLKTSDGKPLLYAFLESLHAEPNTQQLKVLDLLLDQGADLQQTSTDYGVEKTTLEVVIQKPFGLFKKCIESSGIDINEPDNDGNTILHKVCAYDVNFQADKAKDSYRKVKFLVKQGADVSLTNNKDESPLMLASTDNLKERIVTFLLENKL